MLHVLKKYNPKHDKYVTLRNNLVNNETKFYKGREKIIEGFKNKVFPFYFDRDHEDYMKYEEEKEEDDLMDMVGIEDDNRLSDHLVSKYFFVPKLKIWLKYFIQNKNDVEKNNQLINIIESRLKDLNNKINEMPEEERENERVDEITDIVERILAYIKQQQKKEGKGIKILTPNQMLSRLPISLAQLKAGNNSNKLKNEIRQYCIFFIIQKM